MKPGHRRAVILVHGIFSSSMTWNSLRNSLAEDSELESLTVIDFDYYTPRLTFNPLRAIPDHDDVALKLWTLIETNLTTYDGIAILAHSQGGLVVQRMIARQIEAGNAHSLTRLRQVILLACPNSGSDLFLALRRSAFFWHHPQERELRPLNKAIERTRATILQKVVYATDITATTCPIAIHAYAGESDGIVKSQSALSQFPEVGVLEGDHSTILDFGDRNGLNYGVVRQRLREFLDLPSRVQEPAPTTGVLNPVATSMLSRPVQLPRAVPDLRGRDSELQLLNTTLLDRRPTTTSRVILITGRGGIGKTALAVNAATAAVADFDGGVLFANLHGMQSAPADAEAVLFRSW